MRMPMLWVLIGSMAVAGATRAAGDGRAGRGASDAQAAAAATTSSSLDAAAWLSGRWVGTTANGRHIEEMWTPVHDGHMIGTFRWARGSGRWLFEFMSIDTVPPGGTTPAAPPAPLVLRIKHFDRAFRGMEEKTESTSLVLVESSSDHLIFELKEPARTVRVGYRRDGPNRLVVTFDETEQGKPPVHIDFPYARAGESP